MAASGPLSFGLIPRLRLGAPARRRPRCAGRRPPGRGRAGAGRRHLDERRRRRVRLADGGLRDGPAPPGGGPGDRGRRGRHRGHPGAMGGCLPAGGGDRLDLGRRRRERDRAGGPHRGRRPALHRPRHRARHGARLLPAPVRGQRLRGTAPGGRHLGRRPRQPRSPGERPAQRRAARRDHGERPRDPERRALSRPLLRTAGDRRPGGVRDRGQRTFATSPTRS